MLLQKHDVLFLSSLYHQVLVFFPDFPTYFKGDSVLYLLHKVLNTDVTVVPFCPDFYKP